MRQPKELFQLLLDNWDDNKYIGICTRAKHMVYENIISDLDLNLLVNTLDENRSLAIVKFGAINSNWWWWPTIDQTSRKQFITHLITIL